MATTNSLWNTTMELLRTLNAEQKTLRLGGAADSRPLLGDKAAGGDPKKSIWELACEEIGNLDKERNLPNRNTILRLRGETIGGRLP